MIPDEKRIQEAAEKHVHDVFKHTTGGEKAIPYLAYQAGADFVLSKLREPSPSDEAAAKEYVKSSWREGTREYERFTRYSIEDYLAGCAKVRAELEPESIDSPECRRALCVWNCQQRARAEALGGRLLEENEALREALEKMLNDGIYLASDNARAVLTQFPKRGDEKGESPAKNVSEK